MPNIRTAYDAGNLALRPTETGIEARAATARRINAAFNQVGGAEQQLGSEVAALGARQGRATAAMGSALGESAQAAGGVALKWQEHREISQGAPAFTNFLDANSKDWDDTAKNADPNDPTVATQFRQRLENGFDKLRDSFVTEKGRAWAENHIASMRNHFYEKTSADMASRAATAVKTNLDQVSNNLSNTAMRSPDFHTIDYLLGNVNGTVGGVVGSSPNLRGAVAAKAHTELTQSMKEKIVKSGVVGAIQKSDDPERTLNEWAEKYPNYINGMEWAHLAKAAKVQQRTMEADAKREERLIKQETTAASDRRAYEIEQQLRDDPASVTARKAVNDPSLTIKDKRHIERIIDRADKEVEKQTSLANYEDAWRRIQLPYGDPEKITELTQIRELRADGKISSTHYEHLRREFTADRDDGGTPLQEKKRRLISLVDDVIKKASTLTDPLSSTKPQIGAFIDNMNTMVDVYRRAGKDPHDLFDPTKPDYLGKAEVIDAYKKPLSEQIFDAIRSPDRARASTEPQTGTPQRLPGETISAWRERTGR